MSAEYWLNFSFTYQLLGISYISRGAGGSRATPVLERRVTTRSALRPGALTGLEEAVVIFTECGMISTSPTVVARWLLGGGDSSGPTLILLGRRFFNGRLSGRCKVLSISSALRTSSSGVTFSRYLDDAILNMRGYFTKFNGLLIFFRFSILIVFRWVVSATGVLLGAGAKRSFSWWLRGKGVGCFLLSGGILRAVLVPSLTQLPKGEILLQHLQVVILVVHAAELLPGLQGGAQDALLSFFNPLF